MTTSQSRAQRLVDEFHDAAWDEDGGLSVRHGIARVLRHVSDTESDLESFGAIPARTLEELADTLEAPTLSDEHIAAWAERQRLRALLTAEADRPERGE